MADVCSPCLRSAHANCTLGERCPCTKCNPPLVVWEEPPIRGTGTCVISPDVVAELRRNPKRWAKVKVYKSKTGANGVKNLLTKNRIVTIRDPEHWESTARVLPEGAGSAFYLRYVGNGTNGSQP